MNVDWVANAVIFPSSVCAVEYVDQEDPGPLRWSAQEADAVTLLREKLFREYDDVFRDELPGPPPPRSTDLTLPLPSPEARKDVNTTAMFRRIRMTLPEVEFLDRYFEPLRRLGLVRPSTSDFNAPLFCVPKDPLHENPDKHFRPVCDQRIVNDLFPKIATTYLPTSEILQRIARARFASAFDLLAGFHQVNAPEELREFLAFTMPDGSRWEWTVWPFGFTASPAALQRMLSEVIQGLEGVTDYVDDFAVTSGDASSAAPFNVALAEHERTVRAFLDRCRDHQIFLSKSKAQLIVPTVTFLGHDVHVGTGITISADTSSAIRNMPPPSDRKALESVIGSLGWVGTTIPYFAERVAPLRALLDKAKRLDQNHKRGGRRPSSELFPISGEALSAFEDLKGEMSSPRVLAPFRERVPVTLVSDASQFAVAAALYQQDRLVAVWSSTVSETKTRWRVFD